jgi:imidazole glycerol-phosphate synthase subunit HisF
MMNQHLAKRIFPLFLLKQSGRLVKGSQFKRFVDVGDPIAQAMVYDAQGADEIAIVDIDASLDRRLIDVSLIRRMIDHCKLPIAVGGGIRSLDDARQCFAAGADKLILNSHAVLNPLLIRQLADEFGSQAVCVSLDIGRPLEKANPTQHAVYIYAGSQPVDQPLDAIIETCLTHGAGEFMVTSIAHEGMLGGMAISLYRQLRQWIPVPLIASGGAGSYDDVVDVFQQADVDACALGKMLFLRDYDMVRIKAYVGGQHVLVRQA